MKKYFVYELKKSLFVMFALTVIAAVIHVIMMMDDVEFVEHGYARFLSIGPIIAIGCVYSVIVPIWKMSYLMKKRSVDLYYSLPLSHTRILAVKFTVGLIVLFASFTLAFWIGSISMMVAVGEYLICSEFVLQYLSALIPMAAVYSLTAFLFTRANRFIDGAVFVVMTGMSLSAVVDVISLFVFNNAGVYISSGCYAPYGVFTIISTYFQSNFIIGYSQELLLSTSDWVGISLVTALGVAACIGLFLSQRKAKAENCEQISDSYFGYRVTIPLYALCMAILSEGSLMLLALIAAAAYAVCVLYKRTPRIGWQIAVIVGIAFLAGAIVAEVTLQ